MIYLILGLTFILFGYFHLFDDTAQIEVKIVRQIQQIVNRRPLLTFFREIWFLGKTSFTVFVLVLLSIINWKVGIVAAGVFLVIVGIEYIVKNLYNRKRPYTTHQGIAMLQPIEPLDSSFPSGDTLRVWYLALILPAAFSSNQLILGAAISLAILVTLGRMAMGVHYLTDTLSGAGLGIIGAGSTLWLWNLFNIL